MPGWARWASCWGRGKGTLPCRKGPGASPHWPSLAACCWLSASRANGPWRSKRGTARVVAPWVAHWSPDGATHLLHPSRLLPIQSGRLDPSVRGHGADEEGGVVATPGVGRAELLLLLTWGGHPWVLRLADPIGKPGDRKLGGEGSAAGRMWRERWVGWCQVVVEGSLGSRGIFSLEQRIGKSNKPVLLRVETSALAGV
ncbi:hypothetical protein EYF80_035610 [Liparis tanakae]|uniref:Uncharacterized protein n=1 Tax=Liparis tanakae TaxID=230148 RepID=A0A4Z2GNE6_9TELE|nr:hypothetical protein EYF80_035610 [Liparis tanakae]